MNTTTAIKRMALVVRFWRTITNKKEYVLSAYSKPKEVKSRYTVKRQ